MLVENKVLLSVFFLKVKSEVQMQIKFHKWENLSLLVIRILKIVGVYYK